MTTLNKPIPLKPITYNKETDHKCKQALFFCCELMRNHALQDYIFEEGQPTTPLSKPAKDLVFGLKTKFRELKDSDYQSVLFHALLIKARGMMWYVDVMRSDELQPAEHYLNEINSMFGWDAETLGDLGFIHYADADPNTVPVHDLRQIQIGMEHLANKHLEREVKDETILL